MWTPLAAPIRLLGVPDPIVPCAPARLVVLASGTGSLLQSLLAAAVGDFPARVVAVGLDRDCRAAEIAADAGVPAFTVRLSDHPDRAAWDAAITTAAHAHSPDLIVSAGFMKSLVRSSFRAFQGGWSTPIPRCCPLFPVPMRCRTRWHTGSRSLGAPSTSSIPAWTRGRFGPAGRRRER